MRYIKILLCILLSGVGAIGASAQNGINSPYSQYGIGMSHLPYNLPFAASMGGVVYTRAATNMVNPFNPASYAAIQPASFVFDMGLSLDMVRLQDPSSSISDGDGNIGYLSVAFPLTNWWKTSLGLLPLTEVNYESVQTLTDEQYGTMKNIYDGNGGTSRIFWGNAFNIGKELAIGFNANYLCGTIERAITYDFLNNDTSHFIDSRRGKSTRLSNFTFDFGLQYTHALNEQYTLGVGLTLTPHQTLSVRDNALIYTFVSSAAIEYMRDTIFPSAGERSEYRSTLEQPMKVGLGLSLQHNKHWNLAVDASYATFGGMKYTDTRNIFGETVVIYDNNFGTAVGLQLLGDPDAAKYVRRITLSAGAHYEAGKLQLQMADNQRHSLNEWGCGLGLTLPMRRGRSSLTLSLSYDNFGSPDLLRRECLSIGLSMGSCESWFMKRKYN